MAESTAGRPAFRSGFIAVVGRPNVGKSTLVNRMVGMKVTITSSRPNTTRRSVRGVLNREGVQAVFVDTPGLHRPRTDLGLRLNDHVEEALADVDAVVVVVDATAPIGAGDSVVLGRAMKAARVGGAKRADFSPTRLFVVVNKVDRASRASVLEHLTRAAQMVGDDGSASAHGPASAEYFPVSAASGEGIATLVDTLLAGLPIGPPYFPPEMRSDVQEAFWVAELVREQVLRHVRDELPHAVACRVTEWEWPVISVEIVVERDSQKGIVIGRGGQVLKAVGSAVRSELEPGTFLDLRVVVEPHWQQRPDLIERLGY